MAQIITQNGWWWGGSNVNLIAWNGIEITHQTTYELPEWYTQVQRIATQSSGQYINSEIIVDNDMEATFIADVPYINGGALLFGNNVNSSISCTLNVWGGVNPRSRFGSTSIQSTLRRVWRHTYKISKNGIDVDTTHYNWDDTPWTFLQAASSFIFAARWSTTYCPAQTKLYYGNIVKNWDIIAEFIPCIDIQNETEWLYDITNNRFLPISSWSLTVGWPVVPWEVISFVNDAWYLSSSDVVDDLTSSAANKPLSANQWRILNNKINDLMSMGRFLSLWDCSTWLPISFPLSTPYTYHTWDYFMVETLDSNNPATNYRPEGSSYTWSASTTVETWEVQVWDYYVYDGTIWLLASNHWKTVSFANLAWQPTDNANLSNALAAKQNTLIAGTDLSITPWSEIYTLPTWYTQLDYIGLDGVWYFNTGITLADTDKLDITFTTSPDYTGTYFLWGRNGSAGQSIWFISPSANLVQWNDRPSSVSMPMGTKVFLKLKSGELVYTALGTTETKTFTWGSVGSTWVCLIWGAWDGTSSVDSRRFYGYIHKRQILDSTDTLRFNWVPCKNSSDQYWLYDTVSNTFIQSAVTASITWWPTATASDIISFTNTSRYIKNTATGAGSITINGNAAPWNNWVNIWPWSYSAWYSVWIWSGAYSNWGYSVAIGNSSSAASTSAVGIGRWAKSQAVNGIAIGRDASVSGLNGVAIWKDAKNSSAYAIQLGKGTISGASNECQFYVGFDGINQNWKMLDWNTWLIPDARLSSNVQTVTNLVTTLTWADDTHYPSAKAVADAITSAWGWDMLKSTYDPNSVEADAFDYNNFINTPNIPTQTSDLVNNSWFLTNDATWTSALTILGTATAKTQATNVGALSQATANYGTALWSYSQANASHAVAIWNYARTTWQYTIQLWKWTTSTASKLYVWFENDNWELLDGTTWLIPDARISSNIARSTDVSGKQDKATSWSAAPTTTPTYVWEQYVDTTNDKLYVATWTSSSSDWTEVWSWWGWSGDVTWPNSSTDWDIALFDWATGKIIKDSWVALSSKADATDLNTKTFYMSSSSDTTTAQAAYDWWAAGNNPIVIYNKNTYIYNTSSSTQFKLQKVSTQTWINTSDWTTGLRQYYMYYTISSWTVTSVTIDTYGTISSFLSTDYDYSTPYTPQYNGSPATKKYVDDAVAAAASASSQTGNILTSWMKIWAWTETDYWNLGTYDSNCLYLTIE